MLRMWNWSQMVPVDRTETGNMKGRVGLRKRRRQWLKDLEVRSQSGQLALEARM